MMLATFVLGCVAFGGWLVATSADRIALDLLRRSVWLLVIFPSLAALPLGVMEYIAGSAVSHTIGPQFTYLSGILIIVAFEEAIKLGAARTEPSGIRAFALVSLFGIYELALFKPFLLWGVAGQGVEAFWLLASLVPALILHAFTASIYAFHFRNRPVIQFTVCTAIHLTFNLTADAAGSERIWIATIPLLVIATWLLVPGKRSDNRGAWV